MNTSAFHANPTILESGKQTRLAIQGSLTAQPSEEMAARGGGRTRGVDVIKDGMVADAMQRDVDSRGAAARALAQAVPTPRLAVG